MANWTTCVSASMVWVCKSASWPATRARHRAARARPWNSAGWTKPHEEDRTTPGHRPDLRRPERPDPQRQRRRRTGRSDSGHCPRVRGADLRECGTGTPAGAPGTGRRDSRAAVPLYCGDHRVRLVFEREMPGGLRPRPGHHPTPAPARRPTALNTPVVCQGLTQERWVRACCILLTSSASALLRPQDWVRSSTLAPIPARRAAWVKDKLLAARSCLVSQKEAPSNPRQTRASSASRASSMAQMLSSSDHSSSLIILSSSTRISSSPFLLHTPCINLADSSLPTLGAVSTSD